MATGDEGAGPAPAKPKAATPAEQPKRDYGALLRAWLDGHLAGGPVGRNTECWNAVQDAFPALISSLEQGE